MDIRNFKAPSDPSQNRGTSFSGMIPTAPKDDPKKVDTSFEVSEQNDSLVLEEYLSFLEEKKISESMVYQALDQLLTTGQFLWQFNLLEKIPVVFKVRPAFVNSLVIRDIEKANPRTVSYFQDMINISNLAGSLFKYGETTLDASNEESFLHAKEFVAKLPFVITQKLVQELIIFDRLIAAATSDKILENFMKLHSEEREQK